LTASCPVVTQSGHRRHRRGFSSKVIFSDVSLVEGDGGVQSDGWAQTRIGILTPYADVEFRALAPERRHLRPQRPRIL